MNKNQASTLALGQFTQAISASALSSEVKMALIKRGPKKGQSSVEAIAYAREVNTLCARAGHQDGKLAARFVSANASVTSVRQQLSIAPQSREASRSWSRTVERFGGN